MTPKFPKDENGHILRKMYERGDDVSRPRIIDFCFIFPERTQALVFAEKMDDKNLEVCISYYEEREMWQAIIKRYTAPTHHEITLLESILTAQAEQTGGKADGWGCMLIKKA